MGSLTKNDYATAIEGFNNILEAATWYIKLDTYMPRIYNFIDLVKGTFPNLVLDNYLYFLNYFDYMFTWGVNQ